MKVRELLTDPSTWTQGTYARGASGRGTIAQDEDAVAFCLMGAVVRCYGVGQAMSVVIEKIHGAIGEVSGQHWNDDPARTFAEVRQLVEDLDI